MEVLDYQARRDAKADFRPPRFWLRWLVCALIGTPIQDAVIGLVSGRQSNGDSLVILFLITAIVGGVIGIFQLTTTWRWVRQNRTAVLIGLFANAPLIPWALLLRFFPGLKK